MGSPHKVHLRSEKHLLSVTTDAEMKHYSATGTVKKSVLTRTFIH